MESRVSRHYTVRGLGDRILAALTAAGKDVDALTVDDLAPVDEFHIRGRAATEELAGWARLGSGHAVLDVGCGLGGTSRYLASIAGCTVTGVDLTAEYCRVAEMLSARVGLAHQTRFRHGSARDLPFPERSFDVVWTEHVQMNVSDKQGFYGEIHRVLRPGGRLVFHDIFAGPRAEPLRFPVPWASDPSISHLIDPDALATLLGRAGFQRVRWEDRTEESLAFFEKALAAPAQPLGLHLLMGDDARTKFENVAHSLRRGRIRVLAAVLRRP